MHERVCVRADLPGWLNAIESQVEVVVHDHMHECVERHANAECSEQQQRKLNLENES
jgi:hypothetical protein